jgi:DNA-binding NtrC family response regulator
MLWVDANPEQVAWEREVFRALGVVIVTADTTDSALACLQAESFDVVLSDIRRDREPLDGVEGAKRIHAAVPTIPIVFYVPEVADNTVPEPGTGITNEPNELLHLVLDRLERNRSRPARALPRRGPLEHDATADDGQIHAKRAQPVIAARQHVIVEDREVAELP